MYAVLTDNLPVITRILNENRVVRAYAFGSVCTDRFTDASDVDLLIDLDDDPLSYSNHYFRVLDALQTLLGRDVDLVTERSVQSPYFRKTLEATKVPIYE